MQLILQETETVLKHALALNSQKSLWSATVKFLEAWGQVTEILFSVSPVFAISPEIKQGLILEILQALLNKVVSLEIMPELANLASSTVLQLLVNLRHCYGRKQLNDLSVPLQSGNQLINFSSSTSFFLMANNERTQQQYSPKNNSLSLKYILKNIVEWIFISGASPQKLKINLYTSLLNFMHIIKGTTTQRKQDFAVLNETYVSRLDKSMVRIGESKSDVDLNQQQMAVEVFSAVGDKIVDILCNDCAGGHDVCKMLALSCIDMLLDMDSLVVNFIQFISKRGRVNLL